MILVVYVSSAASLLSEKELMSVLEQSRENNTRLHITGLLLYKDGNFMQALEGNEEAVQKLYRTIERDPRHGGVIHLLKENITERQFPAWSMGFRNLSSIEAQQTPGYSPFMNEPLTSKSFQSDPTRAQKLLLTFRESM